MMSRHYFLRSGRLVTDAMHAICYAMRLILLKVVKCSARHMPTRICVSRTSGFRYLGSVVARELNCYILSVQKGIQRACATLRHHGRTTCFDMQAGKWSCMHAVDVDPGLM